MTSPSASASNSTLLDSSVCGSVEGDKSRHTTKTVDLEIESDLGLLSRDPCVARDTGLSIATRRRSLRRGQDQIHSTAAVISVVELKDGEKTREMDTHSEPAGGSINHSGSSFERDYQAVESEEKVASKMASHSR